MSDAAVRLEHALSRFDVHRFRAEFPVLSTGTPSGKPLTFLDSGASAQKPVAVIDRIGRYYSAEHANIHRGVYRLSEQATEAYEHARERVAAFIHAPEAREVIFTRGATDAINLVAASWGGANIKVGDEILLTEMEHHANIVPWQLLAERVGAVIKVVPIVRETGELDLAAFRALLSPRTKLFSCVHVSNALGTVNPVKTLVAEAKAVGATVLLDGAQAVAHFRPNVAELGSDFYVFSGHKVFGPTGIGVLWGRADLLNSMPPYQGGGDMIKKVDFGGTTYREIPERFEAGTPHIAGAIGLGVATDYFSALPESAHAYEQALLDYATERLSTIAGLRFYGVAREKVAVVSFLIDGIHPHDIGTMLDADGICVRTGHHCAMPLMKVLGIPGTVRASFAFYNTKDDVDRLVASLERIRKMF